LPSWSSNYDDRFDQVEIIEPDAEEPVEVLLVPKTLKTPRVIAREPTHMMYMQKAISNELVSLIETPKFEGFKRGNLLHRMLGFSDQIPNRDLAREGSQHGHLATLDLSEASDRVLNTLVRAMVSNFPYLAIGLSATRSVRARVPDKGLMPLYKFASMGSALTFPIEELVFLTCIFLGIEQELRRPLSREDVLSLSDTVRVYGDDLIVPVQYVRSVALQLENYGFRVNRSKSFWTGRFRESCGGDYYDGVDVTVVRCRRMFPKHRQDAAEIASLVSLRNQLYSKGLWRTCSWLDVRIRKLMRFPCVLPSSRVLGRHSFLGYQAERVGPRYHDPQVRGSVLRASLPSSNLDGAGALLKFFLKQSDMPFADREHLLRAGRPRSVDIKHGVWASAI
jgi:hypothetical protein